MMMVTSKHLNQLKHDDETTKTDHGFKDQHCEPELKKTTRYIPRWVHINKSFGLKHSGEVQVWKEQELRQLGPKSNHKQEIANIANS